MDGIEAVVPAVLRGEGERPAAGIDVGAKQLQLQAAGGPVIEPAIVESDCATEIEMRRCVAVFAGRARIKRGCGQCCCDDDGNCLHGRVLPPVLRVKALDSSLGARHAST
ncbi:hypothetical protein G6F65_019466 [Rhizopus arrhizus]|nr:hypothetical protein G6F31_015111 [Rhizopus arrhizus]KAG1248721.1 hypothetical protein G6F65_019466 [Rhizopus arrhizus]